MHPQLKISSLHLRRQKTESKDPRVSRFLSNYGGEQEAPEEEDEKNGDMEVDSNEFMKACSKSLSERRNPVLWLPGKYWSDEPGTMVLEILDKEVKNTEEKKLTLWPFKE